MSFNTRTARGRAAQRESRERFRQAVLDWMETLPLGTIVAAMQSMGLHVAAVVSRAIVEGILRRMNFEQLSQLLSSMSFAGGGEVPGRLGEAVRITAHVGEWVLNPEQQMRVARLVGGWDVAKRYLFETPVLSPHLGYAVGGPVLAPARAASGPTWSGDQNLNVYTASPDIDIDYIMRIAAARVSGVLVPGA